MQYRHAYVCTRAMQTHALIVHINLKNFYKHCMRVCTFKSFSRTLLCVCMYEYKYVENNVKFLTINVMAMGIG